MLSPYILNKVKIILILLFIFLAILYVRGIFTQVKYYSLAQDYFSKGNYIRAIDNYGKTLNFYVVFSPYNKKSIVGLKKCAEIFSKKDKKMELYAYETLRSSLYGGSSLYMPYSDMMPEIVDKIATLRAELLKKDKYPKTFEQAKQEQLKIMNKSIHPSNFYSFVAVLFFLIFLGGGFTFAWFGFEKSGRIKLRPAAYSFVTMAVSFSLFIFGLYMA